MTTTEADEIKKLKGIIEAQREVITELKEFSDYWYKKAMERMLKNG